MTRDEVAEHLRSLTYLPGWTFEVYEGNTVEALLNGLVYGQRVGDNDVLLLVHFPAPESSDEPGEEATVELARPLVVNSELVPDVEALEDVVFVHLARVQMHELGELVKFGGHAPFHPHRWDGKERIRAVDTTLRSLELPLLG